MVVNGENKDGISWQHLVRAVLFVALIAVAVACLSVVFTPDFDDVSESDVSGLYDQPENTIQVLSLGASTLRRGFSPDYLYEKQGAVAWNSCTGSQPMIASYHLLKDALRTQGDSLSLVLVDVKAVYKSVSSSHAESVGIDMPFSLNKLSYLWDMSNEYDEVEFIEQLIPALRFHSRWSELHRSDFLKLLESKERDNSLRGQAISYESNASKKRPGQFTADSIAKVTAKQDLNETRVSRWVDDLNMKYFEMLINECKQRGIHVMLVSTPDTTWTNFRHDAFQLISKEYDVPMLDMNSIELIEQLGISFDTDYYDNKHPNLMGSMKITDYIGDYIAAHYDLRDNRGDSKYGFMQSCTDAFDAAVEDASIARCRSLDEYLDLINKDRYTVFAAVMGEAAESLTPEERAKLEDIGLGGLAHLQAGGSYAGVVHRGELVGERVNAEGQSVTVCGSYNAGDIIVRGISVQENSKLDFPFQVSSRANGEGSSVIKFNNGINRSENARGINFVVCDADTGSFIDTCNFDTHVGPARTSD